MRTLCKKCGKKLKKVRVSKIVSGTLGFGTYCPHCEPYKLRWKME